MIERKGGIRVDEMISAQVNKLLKDKRRRTRRLAAFLLLAFVVTLVTTNALTLDTEAKVYTERVLSCAYEPHVHGESCYNEAGELICGQADFVLHVHNDDCYDYYGNLVCPLPEIPEHRHAETCYEERMVLTCQEDTTGHVHTEACWTYPEETVMTEDGTEVVVRAEEPVLICGMEEGEGAHVHDEDCYELERRLVCGLEEHTRHSHTEDCYNEAGELICGRLELHEHFHGSACLHTVELSKEEVIRRGLAGESSEAEEESPAVPAEFSLTGVWNEDVAAAAA